MDDVMNCFITQNGQSRNVQ